MNIWKLCNPPEEPLIDPLGSVKKGGWAGPSPRSVVITQQQAVSAAAGRDSSMLLLGAEQACMPSDQAVGWSHRRAEPPVLCTTVARPAPPQASLPAPSAGGAPLALAERSWCQWVSAAHVLGLTKCALQGGVACAHLCELSTAHLRPPPHVWCSHNIRRHDD